MRLRQLLLAFAVTTAAHAEPSAERLASAQPRAQRLTSAHREDAAVIEGIVKPSRYVVIKSPLVATVDRVLAAESQQVREGELLVQLDARVQDAVTARARVEADADAELRRTEAALAEVALALDSTRQMHTKKAATDWELHKAQLQHDQAQAARDAAAEVARAADATLVLEERRLDEYTLRAPFDGHVIRIEAREGSTVSEEQPVLAFAQLDPLEAELHLPAELYNSMQVGQTVELEAGAPVSRMVTARCKTREPMIDSASRTFRCVFVIENAEAALPAGFAVEWSR
jgi:RND family efflux transporter MFP subunit